MLILACGRVHVVGQTKHNAHSVQFSALHVRRKNSFDCAPSGYCFVG